MSAGESHQKAVEAITTGVDIVVIVNISIGRGGLTGEARSNRVIIIEKKSGDKEVGSDGQISDLENNP